MGLNDTKDTGKNFIVFEGIDGSGTTTQLKRLSSILKENGFPVLATSEPTTRPEGALIRTVLRGETKAEPGTIAFLFAADRHQHLYGGGGILEALSEGKIVICDRYVLSSLAYQGIACGNDLPAMLNSRFPAPGLTVFFRIDPQTAMKRVSSRSELEIYEKLGFQEQVGRAYEEQLSLARERGWKTAAVDAGLPIQEVTRRICVLFEEHLGIRLGR